MVRFCLDLNVMGSGLHSMEPPASVQPWIDAPEPFTPLSHENLSGELREIYHFCLENRATLQGRKVCSFVMDTSKKDVYVTKEGTAVKVERLKMTNYALLSTTLTEVIAAFQKWKFYFNGAKATFITPHIRFKEISIVFFSGNEFERRSYLKDTEMAPFAKWEWDTWERLNSKALNLYENWIYPQILKSLTRIFDAVQGKALDILDLGGGSGGLAQFLLEQIPASLNHITLVDFSEVLIERAQQRLAGYAGKYTIICRDITQSDPLPQGTAQRFGVIILSGIVAIEVLTRAQSLILLEKCFSMVSEKGYVIVTSFSPAHLCSKDYVKMGYRVLNQSMAGKVSGQWDPFDFYILQRP